MRRTHLTGSAPGRTVSLEGVEYLFFGGTAYLGMHLDPAFATLLKEGLEKYGAAYGSSRASNLQLAVYAQAEDRLAAWQGTEACTLLSSGYLAGQLVTHYLQGAGWDLYYAPGAHPALMGGRHGGPALTRGIAASAAASHAVSPGASWDEWVDWLIPRLKRSAGKQAILACSVDPLHSRLYDFSFTRYLPRGKEILLVIDDSHGLGVLGEGGEGIVSSLPGSLAAELMIVASLGKAMGIPAGAVWSTSPRMRRLRELAFFISASPPSPAALHAFLHGGTLYRQAMTKLKSNIAYFSQLVEDLEQIRHAPGLPVFLLDDPKAAAHLEEQRMLISSFPYPEADSIPLSRIVLSSLHTTADLERLAAALKDYLPD